MWHFCCFLSGMFIGVTLHSFMGLLWYRSHIAACITNVCLENRDQGRKERDNPFQHHTHPATSPTRFLFSNHTQLYTNQWPNLLIGVTPLCYSHLPKGLPESTGVFEGTLRQNSRQCSLNCILLKRLAMKTMKINANSSVEVNYNCEGFQSKVPRKQKRKLNLK